MFTLEELRAAHETVRDCVAPTPAHAWPLLGRLLEAPVVVKHENHTPTGAFKVRGGLVYMKQLARDNGGVKGLVCATRGNHGQSIALAARRHGIPATIYVPEGNSAEKNDAMRSFGAELVVHGSDFHAAREAAEHRAQTDGLTMVPSFHRDLVLGVATYALELFDAHGDLDVVYVPIGLGSGICGAILARDLLGLKTEIVGVQARGAPCYARSFAAGKPVSTEQCETFADGIATRVPDQAALDIILAGAARIVEVDDDQIAEAVRHYWTHTHNLAEGAGAAPLAAALAERERNAGRRIGLILSGGNIDLDLFRRLVLPAQGKAA